MDIDRFHVAAIQKNFDTLEFNNVMVIRSDVFRFIKQSSIKCNLIFADPPFDLPDFASIPDKIIQSDLLKPEGLLILEHGPKYSFENHVNFTELRKYGKVRFSFFSI